MIDWVPYEHVGLFDIVPNLLLNFRCGTFHTFVAITEEQFAGSLSRPNESRFLIKVDRLDNAIYGSSHLPSTSRSSLVWGGLASGVVCMRRSIARARQGCLSHSGINYTGGIHICTRHIGTLMP